MSEKESTPRGRRGGDPEQTRRAILRAAQLLFAKGGFEGTSVRAIAREAAVDPALVAHYFDSKEHLFLATHQIPSDPLILVGEALRAPLKDRGEILARSFFERFLADPNQIGVSVIRSAVTEEFAAHLLRDSVVQAINSHSAQLTDNDDDADIRVTLAIGMLIGIVFQRTILKIESLSTMDAGDLARRVGPSIQALLAPTNQPPKTDRLKR